MKYFIKVQPILKKIFGSTSVFILALSFHACESNLEDVGPQDPLQSEKATNAYTGAEFIEGRYIVVFREDKVAFKRNMPEPFEQRREKAKALGHTILNERGIPTQALYSAYGFALSGFAAELTPGQVKALQADPRVSYIERDQIVRLIEPQSRASITSDGSASTEAPTGVTRVGGGTGDYTSDFTKRVYVIDTGILMFNNSAGELITHPDLNTETVRNRTYNAFCDDIVGGNLTSCEDKDRYPNDGNGHGTHVAGTIGAKLDGKGVVGVAPGVKVVPVKVLGTNGAGNLANVLEGLDFVAYEAITYTNEGVKVANMSLGASASTTLDDAVINVAEKGVLFSLAAGNDGLPAKNYSPARVNHSNVFTVAAMSTKRSAKEGWTDTWASFSNYGQPPIDYIAPGVSVLSTYVNVVTEANGLKSYEPSYQTLSGTSMAAPHVSGILILNGKILNGTVGTVINTDGLVKRTVRDTYKVAHR